MAQAAGVSRIMMRLTKPTTTVSAASQYNLETIGQQPLM